MRKDKTMLEILMKAKELREAKAELERLNTEKADLEKREAELAQDIEKAESDEEKKVVQEAVTEFRTSQQKNKEDRESLEKRVADIEAEIADLEKNQSELEERKDNKTMITRTLGHMDASETRAFVEREDVKQLLSQVREAYANKRDITGAELTIPQVMLSLLRENIEEYSKLYKHVNAVAVSGEAVMPVMGTIPEAVWTQCCGNINKLNLTFNAAEVGCWKVGGYFQLCKATEEDSAVDLAGEIVTALGAAIGIALDKAIVYGLGTRMPLGVFTRLAQTEKPADYSDNERAWADLHTSNIISISAANSTGVKLFQNIVTASGNAKGKYSRGEKTWIVNEKTYTKLQAEGLTVNAAGAIVTGVAGTMPVVGGVLEVLDFIPDDVIVGGYFDLYLLAERAGTNIQRSDEVKFLEDAAVFKGTARYDGKPVIAEGFVAIGINGVTPSADGITFAADEANA